MTPFSSSVYWNGLAHLLCDRPDLFKKLIDQVAPERAWGLSSSALHNIGWPAPFVASFIEQRASFDLFEATSRLRHSNIYLLAIRDAGYPALVKELSVPPQVLYVRGNLEILNATLKLSAVGSRHLTSYGKEVIQLLLPGVVNAGVVLVSGLAYGVDAEVHRVSVAAQAPTIAVLGGGIDDATLHPKCNVRLAHDLLACNGVLLSEYPPGTPAQKHRFPQRNRIIAGLSKTTLIIEAAERSGSLITARLAVEENRDVLAVPGNITQPLSAGCNRLIADGASPIRTCQDLCDRLSLTSVQQNPSPHFRARNEAERQILAALTAESPRRVDKLFEICRLNITTFHQTLSELELDGKIIINGERISLPNI